MYDGPNRDRDRMSLSENEGRRPRVSVIVPTFREAENLPRLVPRIHAALAAAGMSAEIVVVDDDSPDDTARVCARLREDHPLRLVVRKNERGLSSAVLAGFDEARGDVLAVIDADLSHPPETLPGLVRSLDDGPVEFALGSRYVKGGSTAEDWGALRWLNSRVATALARPLTTIKDPMSGFFAIRRETVEAFRESLDPIGYKIGLELVVKCGVRRVAEVPIEFRDRQAGTSKLGLREQLSYLWHLKRLYEHRFRHWAYFAQFALVGLTGVVVDVLSFSLLRSGAALSFPLSRALAIWIAMSWNFMLNRSLTFSYAKSGPALRQYAEFCASCLLGAAVNWTTSVALRSVHSLFQTYELAGVLAGIAAGTLFNYVMSRKVVFRVS